MNAALGAHAREPEPQAIDIDINNWSRKKRQHLADDESAYDSDAERTSQFRSSACAES